MPDRYWVGGSGTWDTTSTARWSATSGGAPGASVPTSADDVFFDANSGAPLTINSGVAATQSCRNLTISVSGVTHAGTGGTFSIAGSMTLHSGTTWTRQGGIAFTSTASGNTITTNGVSLGSAVTFNGVGGVWNLGSSFTNTNTAVTVTNGTFNTAGFTITTPALVSSNSNIRTINLGASTVNLTVGSGALDLTTSTNLTFNVGTSQINFTSNSAEMRGGGRTFHNVSFTSADIGTRAIAGANTFNNLTLNASITGLSQLALSANQVVSGTLTCAGSSAVARGFVRSDTIGTVRTITAAAVSANDCDFRDITIAGAAAPIAPTRAGDCGGNSGITFPAAKTVYRVGTNATWGGSNSWATSSGGAGADNNFPLAQDTAVIDNNTSLTGILDLSSFNNGTLDASTRTTSITFNHSLAATRYGSFTLGSGVTVINSFPQTFAGRGTMDFTSAGKTITFPTIVNALGGTFRLLDATLLSNTFTLTQGTLNLNNLTLTSTTFASNNSNARIIAFGTGNITVTGTGTVWNASPNANLTTTGTQVVNVSNGTSSAASIVMGNYDEANAISFNITTGNYQLTLGNTTTVRNLNFTGFSGTLFNSFNIAVFGNIILSSSMSITTSSSLILSSTSATPRTIRSNGVSFGSLSFNGVGGIFQLLDAAITSSTVLYHYNGTVDLNGYSLTAAMYTTGAGVKNITFNGGSLFCTIMFDNAAPTGFTTTAGAGTGSINMIDFAGACTFVGGGSTYNCTLNYSSGGDLTITGSNTFTTISNTTPGAVFLFESGSTTTLTNWNINGAPGNLTYIGSTASGSHTLSKASGVVSANYLFIVDSNATGGAQWFASNSTDGGNNSGWTFGAGIGNFFMLLFR